MHLNFTDEPLEEIVATLEGALGMLESGGRLEVSALDPDLSLGHYAGERLKVGGILYRHRPLRAWLDLAERFGCRLHTPSREGQHILLTFSRLEDTSWHENKGAGSESYGPTSDFSRVEKLEEPTFSLDYAEALRRVGLQCGQCVLSLGVGRGDELLPFIHLYPDTDLTFTGVDHSAGALREARTRFPTGRYTFLEGDLNALGTLELGRFDLVLSIATFQSPGVQGHTLIREVVQQHLTTHGNLILALPNCRYRDGEVLFGAKMKNFARPDLSLVVKDLAFYRKYLQQHGFQVSITGKYYLFLTAIRTQP